MSLYQTALGDRFAILMLAVQVGDRSLPLAWAVEVGAANIGFAGQQGLLKRIRAWLPAGAAVLLLGDRFYPSAALLAWLHQHGWQYRLRLKGNLTVDTGCCEVTTGELAYGVSERYLPDVKLFKAGADEPGNLAGSGSRGAMDYCHGLSADPGRRAGLRGAVGDRTNFFRL